MVRVICRVEFTAKVQLPRWLVQLGGAEKVSVPTRMSRPELLSAIVTIAPGATENEQVVRAGQLACARPDETTIGRWSVETITM